MHAEDGMKMRGKLFGIAVLALAALLAGGSALAQSGEAPPAPAPPPGQEGPRGMGGPDDALAFIGFEGGFAGKTVTGAPFSASISTVMTEKLADGNKIERRTSGTLARDSQGRTRRDLTLPAIGPWAASGQAAPRVILINDPVAATRYLLDPDSKVAREIPPGGWRARFGEKQGSGKDEKDKDVVTTSLGTKTINGVPAQGTRITRTIPAGAIGNVKPIRIVIERWYSPDLQTNVLVKRSDPRMGETIFQLTDIERKEPDASLFQVPSDYAVKQGGPGGRGRFGRRREHMQPPPGENEPGEAPPAPPQQAPQQ